MDLERIYDGYDSELDDTLDSSYFSSNDDEDEDEEAKEDLTDSYYRKISDL